MINVVIETEWASDGITDNIKKDADISRKYNAWCKENCSGVYIIDQLALVFRCSFVEESDAMAFKLMWA